MARFTDIVVDAVDPPLMARFWANVLDDYAIRPYDAAEIERLETLGFTPETDPTVALDGPGPTVFFQRVERAHADHASKRADALHLDLRSPDTEAECERLRALGARMLAEHADHRVLCDPEGNRFCLLPSA